MNRDFQLALLAGRRDFEAGRFHAAHEAWEAGWRRAQGDERLVLQALVLWAAALHHHQHGRELGAHRLLLRALERLAQARDELPGLDVDALREALVESLEATRAPFRPDARPRWFLEGHDGAEPDAVQLEHPTSCPYCGEPVLVALAPEDANGADYVEDCPVCCRPWQVNVVQEAGVVHVALGRDDAQGQPARIRFRAPWRAVGTIAQCVSREPRSSSPSSWSLFRLSPRPRPRPTPRSRSSTAPARPSRRR